MKRKASKEITKNNETFDLKDNEVAEKYASTSAKRPRVRDKPEPS